MKPPVFVFEGGDLTVFASVVEAEGGTEVYELDVLEYFDAEGTVLHAIADGYRVRLTPTRTCRPQDLHARLDAYLRQPRVNMDPALADNPARLAAALAGRAKQASRRRRPKWSHRQSRP
jgi:hypothetical protein